MGRMTAACSSVTTSGRCTAGSMFIGEAGDMLLGGIRAVVTMKGRKLGLSPRGQCWQQGGSGAAFPPAHCPPSTTAVCTGTWGHTQVCCRTGFHS